MCDVVREGERKLESEMSLLPAFLMKKYGLSHMEGLIYSLNFF